MSSLDCTIEPQRQFPNASEIYILSRAQSAGRCSCSTGQGLSSTSTISLSTSTVTGNELWVKTLTLGDITWASLSETRNNRYKIAVSVSEIRTYVPKVSAIAPLAVRRC